jgi:hypothetical protein
MHQRPRRGGNFGEALRLVADHDGDFAQLVLIQAGMVGAEEQFRSCEEPHLDVSLSPAAIASIDGREP